MPAKEYGPTPRAPTPAGISARVGRACAVLAQAREQLDRVQRDAGELSDGAGDLLAGVVAIRLMDLGAMIRELQYERDLLARAAGVRTKPAKGRG